MAIIDFKKILATISKKPPTRFYIAVMLFLACMMSYMMRVNLSIEIIAMVKPSSPNETALDHGPRYDWDQETQGYLLGAYFWGYLLTSLPAGIAAEHFGGRAMVGYTLGASAVLTALIPISAKLSFWAIVVIRALTGVLGGFMYPALHCLISKWSPPDEKGKFVAALMGGTFGTVITWPLCGAITTAIGYAWAFYISAIFCIVITAIWFLVVADKPETHKNIDKEEREYIENSLATSLSKTSKCPPVLSLILSPPFWALLVLHYGNMWGLYFLLTAAPKFMSEVLKFKLTESGFLSSLPHLARLLSAFAFGAIGDKIRRSECMSVTLIRKSFTLFSHIIPGVLLIVMAFYGTDNYVCVALMTLSLGFNGAAAITNLQNSQDLAPNYAGTLYGIINFVGTTPGIIAPMVVAFFTKDANTIKEWVNVFLTGAGAYIFPAIFFVIFGSGVVQHWNENKSKPKVDTDA